MRPAPGVVVLLTGASHPRRDDYSIVDLPSKAARERLVELKYDDKDQISRLRVTGRGRLYGFRRDERFYALWWDPEHAIYPTKKKHT